MTADRRLVIYNKINQIATSVTNVAELLRKGYGLSPKPCAFSFSKSLKVPENSIADLLHNIGINANAWILSLIYFLLNEKNGRIFLISELKKKGKKLKNTIIANMFQGKNGKPITFFKQKTQQGNLCN